MHVIAVGLVLARTAWLLLLLLIDVGFFARCYHLGPHFCTTACGIKLLSCGQSHFIFFLLYKYSLVSVFRARHAILAHDTSCYNFFSYVSRLSNRCCRSMSCFFSFSKKSRIIKSALVIISRGRNQLIAHAPLSFLPRFFWQKCVKRTQGIVIAGLVKVNLIHEIGSWTTDNVEKGIQDLLVCVEMLLIAVAHTTAFSSEPYEDGATRRDSSSLLEAHFAHHSAVRDFNEVSTCAFRWRCIRLEVRADPPRPPTPPSFKRIFFVKVFLPHGKVQAKNECLCACLPVCIVYVTALACVLFCTPPPPLSIYVPRGRGCSLVTVVSPYVRSKLACIANEQHGH